jgi:pSer/pThr/pTyr-binding forkhead associated (FHA) protein
MELKLIVLAGAKEGTQIPLKKDKFVIGRAAECTLRAGSEAISRRHCAIVRVDGDWVASDLGSRNGTYLNDQKIEVPTALSVGDELRVGPLKFRVEPYVKQGSDVKVPKPTPAKVDAAADAAAADVPQDINRSKQPPVKSVAEVIERTVSNADGSTSEDDVSRWLLGISDARVANSTRETRTLSMEETTTLGLRAAMRPEPATSSVGDSAEESATDAGEEVEVLRVDEANGKSETGSGGWSFFKMGKGGDKKKPGKLPPRPAEVLKDSREAAADILREMTRRR